MAPNVTILRGDNIVYREDLSGVIIKVGQLVDFDSNGRLRPHATSGGASGRSFAVEPDFLGKDTTYSYASGDRVQYADCTQGTIVYAHLASGQNVARGADLMSNGAGFLTAATSTNQRIAQADEAVDASSGVAAGASSRIRVRVI